MLNLSVDSKGYGVKDPMSCVLYLVCLTSLLMVHWWEVSNETCWGTCSNLSYINHGQN